jgi:hypothetical protein
VVIVNSLGWTGVVEMPFDPHPERNVARANTKQNPEFRMPSLSPLAPSGIDGASD